MDANRVLLPAVAATALGIALTGCASSGRSSHSPDEAGPPPYVALSVTRQPAADFSAAPSAASVRTKENQVSAGFHRFERGTGTLDLGLDYQYTRYVYDGIDGRNRDLHRFQFPLRYQDAFRGWAVDASLAPGISTSSNVLKEFFDRISRDDVFVSARLEARRSSPREWILGMAYDRTFGKPSLYPIAGIEWSPGDNLAVRLAFPDPGFRYRVTPRQSVSGRLFPAGHQWHVMTDDFSAEFDYRVEGIRSQLSWSIGLSKSITLDVSGGFEFARKHYLTDDLGVRIESDVDDEWLLLIGLRAGPAPIPYTHGSRL